MDSEIPRDKRDAYAAADYRVTGTDPAFALRVDRPSDGLRLLYAAHAASSAAFITAWNPGQIVADSENVAAQAKLLVELGASGYPLVSGYGTDASGDWPHEDSVLALGISLADARALGKRYRQDAILWSDTDAVPRLIVLR